MWEIRPGLQRPSQNTGPKLSKAHFRWQRDWSARIRRLVFIYLPLLGLGLFGWHVARDSQIRNAVEVVIDEIVHDVMADTDLAVRGVEIVGASGKLKAYLTEITDPLIDMSTIELGVRDLRQSIEDLDEVRKARVTLTPTGVLKIVVEKRRAAALFRDGSGRLGVIDREGIEIRPVRERRSEPELILLLGKGATDHVSEALEIMSVAQGLRDRLRAMVRIGERRWDVILDRDMRILLPAKEPVTAMARMMEQHQGASKLLDRDLTVVDLRIADRPTFRIPPRAMETRKRENLTKNTEGKDT